MSSGFGSREPRASSLEAVRGISNEGASSQQFFVHKGFDPHAEAANQGFWRVSNSISDRRLK
jgi:hypothetical protein